jgi:PKD repeat protein
MMKYYRNASILFCIALTTISISVFTNSGGPPLANTAAPGDGNCTGCHSGSLITSGTDWNNFSITSTIPGTGYVPGTTYTITITHTVSGISRWGFQATVLNSSNAMAGTIINTNTSQMGTGTSGGKTYISHNSGGNSGSGTRTWTFDWTAPNPGVGTITVYAVVNAANNNSSTSGDQIYAKSVSFNQQGQAPPTAVIANDRDSICAGESIQFNGSGTNNPTSYSWLFSGGTPQNTNQQNPLVTYANAGSFTARLITTNSFGSSSPVTKTIVVKPKPTASVSPAGPVTVCGNDSVLLSSSTSTGTQYLWSPGNATTSGIYAKNTGNYSVLITAPNGCSTQSNTVTVTQRNKPSVTLQANRTTTCSNDSVTFTALPAGLTAYQFKTLGVQLQNSSSHQYKTLLLLPLSNVYVIATDSFGCKSDSTNGVNVVVQTAPAGPATVSCDSIAQNFIRFRWSSVSSALGYEISTDSGRTWNTPSSGNLGLTHSISGLNQATRITLFARAILLGPVCTRSMPGIGSCVTPGCVNITYNLAYDSVKTVCAVATTDTATVTITNSNVSAYFYRVDEVNASGNVIRTVIPFGATPAVRVPLQPTGIHRFRISLYDAALLGCDTARQTFVIRTQQEAVNAPVIQLNKPGLAYCNDEDVIITTLQLPGKSVYQLYKYNNLLFTGSSLSWTLSPAQAEDGAVFRVVALDTITNCPQISNGAIIQRKPSFVASFTANQLSLPWQVEFNDSSSQSVSRKWYFGDGGTDTARTSIHNYASIGVYDVTLITSDADACTSDSVPVQITVLPLSVGYNLNKSLIHFYPNPAKGELYLESEEDIQSVYFTSIHGSLVQVDYSYDGQLKYWFNLNELSDGVYLLHVRSKSDTFIRSFKVIVAH